MMPEPPRIGSLITGALITLLSSTMAKGLPTFSRVASAKRRAPIESNLKLTTGCVVVEARLRVGQRVAADHHAAAHDIVLRRAGALRVASRRQQLRRPAAAGRAAHRRATRSRSTSWKVIFAVLPSSSLMCSGLSTPGSCTRMRSAPSRWMLGLLGAGLVDAAAHDLDRLVHRRGAARVERRLVRLDRHRAAGAARHVEVGIDLRRSRRERRCSRAVSRSVKAT